MNVLDMEICLYNRNFYPAYLESLFNAGKYDDCFNLIEVHLTCRNKNNQLYISRYLMLYTLFQLLSKDITYFSRALNLVNRIHIERRCRKSV